MRYRVWSSIALALACRRYLLRSPSGASQIGPLMAAKIRYNGKDITQDDFDLAVEWMQATAPDQGGKMTRLASKGE